MNIYMTYTGWRNACELEAERRRTIVLFDGDKDICEALLPDINGFVTFWHKEGHATRCRSIGQWNGSEGHIRIG